MGTVGSVLSGGGAPTEKRPEPEPRERSEPQVRLVCFDFDCTLSVIHMFKEIAGWERPNQLDPPFAQSEKGQIAKIRELNQKPWAAAGSPPQLFVEASGTIFSAALLGGEQRVSTLRAMLTHLQASRAEAVIITKGYVGAVQQVMQDVGLLQYFAAVYGLTGNIYGTTEYDIQVQHLEFGLEGRPEQQYSQKSAVIQQIAGLRQLSPDEILFVDDDPQEVRGVAAARCARTLHVVDRHGMTGPDLQAVCDLTKR
jgi:FMN phosphatase YigB (HAD superfamily)